MTRKTKIKGHGEITIHRGNIAYIPKHVVDELGNKTTFLLSPETVLLFASEADPEKLLKSLDIFKAHIEIQLPNKEQKTK